VVKEKNDKLWPERKRKSLGLVELAILNAEIPIPGSRSARRRRWRLIAADSRELGSTMSIYAARGTDSRVIAVTREVQHWRQAMLIVACFGADKPTDFSKGSQAGSGVAKKQEAARLQVNQTAGRGV
jgi:hypothetical protein